MGLFIHDSQEERLFLPLNVISTPLGTVSFTLETNSVRLSEISPEATCQLRNGGHIARWNHNGVQAELLVTKHTPQLPCHMHIDDCYAVVWRIINRVESNICFSSKWNDYYEWIESSPESGEDLDAITWEGNNIRVSMGTQDGQKLRTRSIKNEMMPVDFVDDLNLYGLVLCMDNELRVPLHSVRPNEVCQIHFVIAWSKSINDDVSTWYAVDEESTNLLNSAGVK